MNASPRNRIGGLLLAVVLLLGMGLPVVQGGMTAAAMAASTEPGCAGSHGCDGCAGDDGHGAIDTCLSTCAFGCQCVLLEEPVAPAPAGATDFQIADPSPCDCPGRTDHGPPKSLILG